MNDRDQDGVFAQLRRSYKYIPPLDLSDFSLTEKTILITGSNKGIGYATAARLAKCNGTNKTIILAVRNLEKGRAARRCILSTLNTLKEVERPTIEVFHLDQMSLASVRHFVTSLEGRKIDVAILNAAILYFGWETSEDGYEQSLQTNYLSTVYLALLLLPNLRKASMISNVPARLTMVSSDAHYHATFPERNSPNILSALNDKSKFREGERYGVTKALIIMFGRSLAQNVDSKDIIVNTVHPGCCATEIGQNSPWIVRIWMWLLARPVEEGATVLMHASMISGPESHGGFYSECERVHPARYVRDMIGIEAQDRLWSEVLKLLGETGSKNLGNV